MPDRAPLSRFAERSDAINVKAAGHNYHEHPPRGQTSTLSRDYADTDRTREYNDDMAESFCWHDSQNNSHSFSQSYDGREFGATYKSGQIFERPIIDRMGANSAIATIRRALDDLSRKSVSDGATVQRYDGSQPATQQGSMHRTTGNDLTRKEDFYGMRCTEPQIEE
jgi:hypothetical protein